MKRCNHDFGEARVSFYTNGRGHRIRAVEYFCPECGKCKTEKYYKYKNETN